MNRLDIAAVAGVKTLLKSRYPQLAILALMLAGYIFAIMSSRRGILFRVTTMSKICPQVSGYVFENHQP